MKKNNVNSFKTSSIRDKAKEQLMERKSERRDSRFGQGEQYQREADLIKPNHELAIHQIELELQNAALREALNKAETAISLYISDRKLLEARIQEQKQFFEQAKEETLQSDRLKSAFLANISHEIRTPLNSIIGFSELMSEPDFDPAQQFQFSKIIFNSGNKLLSIISDIMELSKIDAGEVQINPRHLLVSQVINDIKKEYNFKAAVKDIEMRLDLHGIKDVVIESDENKLRQVLINFVDNALKFTENELIEIGARINGEFVLFHVKDTGIGIPTEFQAQIFERFRQVESVDTRKYGGNRLGLTISKALVELLGGEVWLESGEGIGSTFYFTIPIRAKANIAPRTL